MEGALNSHDVMATVQASTFQSLITAVSSNHLCPDCLHILPSLPSNNDAALSGLTHPCCLISSFLYATIVTPLFLSVISSVISYGLLTVSTAAIGMAAFMNTENTITHTHTHTHTHSFRIMTVLHKISQCE